MQGWKSDELSNSSDDYWTEDDQKRLNTCNHGLSPPRGLDAAEPQSIVSGVPRIGRCIWHRAPLAGKLLEPIAALRASLVESPIGIYLLEIPLNSHC